MKLYKLFALVFLSVACQSNNQSNQLQELSSNSCTNPTCNESSKTPACRLNTGFLACKNTLCQSVTCDIYYVPCNWGQNGQGANYGYAVAPFQAPYVIDYQDNSNCGDGTNTTTPVLYYSNNLNTSNLNSICLGQSSEPQNGKTFRSYSPTVAGVKIHKAVFPVYVQAIVMEVALVQMRAITIFQRPLPITVQIIQPMLSMGNHSLPITHPIVWFFQPYLKTSRTRMYRIMIQMLAGCQTLILVILLNSLRLIIRTRSMV